MNVAFPPSPRAGAAGLPDAAAAAGAPPFLAPSATSNKRKRRPAGTPDPDAEVVALSPKTLMESDRYVCEICNQGFQRDQNLQMHRRRHKVPWKLLKRPSLATTKRVYICPERSCLHHDPAHALGDLVGIKKHYRRKHCSEKQWRCEKCAKGYAVQSDYKAHLKTCGTRGHCCDCGRVFSRVESFIEHQDTCGAVKRKSMHLGSGSEGLPRHQHRATDTNESPSQSSDTTQALSFTQSGMSDTAGGSVDTNSAMDEHARRVQAESHAATPSSALPSWLTGSRGPLQWPPSDHAQVSTRDSRPQVTRCSSNLAACLGGEAISCFETKTIFEPSLQLSLGRAGVQDSYTDIKPSFRTAAVAGRELLAATDPKSIFGVETVRFDALAYVGPASLAQPGPHRRMERAGTVPMESNAGRVHQLTKPKRSRSELLSYYNPITSSYHEHQTENLHASDQALGERDGKNEFRHSDDLFGAKSVSNELMFRSENRMDAGVGVQVQDEVRRECEEAERELARAERLKREAREQLQVAAAETAYAERAREAAKRQVEICEAELVEAKRLRAQAQAELASAGSPSLSTSLCRSCQSAIESIPSRRSSSASPTSWSVVPPLPPADRVINRMSWSDLIPGFDPSLPPHAHNLSNIIPTKKSPPRPNLDLN